MSGRATRRGVLASLSAALAGPAVADTGAIERATRNHAFDPRAFGAKGDGRSDDTPAFRAMHRAMRLLQDRAGAVELVVQLPPGHYRYDWNRWTWGLRRVTVMGYGAAIQCTHRGPFDLDQAPLLGNRDHYWTWDPAGPAFGPPSPVPVEDYGWLIRTARPGDEAVQPFAPVPVRPGEWVLIQSYAQQQDGYPPNLRYFERARVLGTENGVVRLDRPLRHLHRDDWPEDPRRPAAIGRARLVAIDRPDCPLALSQQFMGFTVLPNPNHAVRDPNVRRTREVLGLSGTLRAEVRDCTLIALGVSQCGEVSVENTTFDYVEPDKLVDRLTLRGCAVGEIRECTGVNQLVLQDCTVETSAQLLARNVSVSGCVFALQVAPNQELRALSLEGPTPTRRMTVTGCRFPGSGGEGREAIGGPVWVRVVLEGDALRVRDGRRVEAVPGPACAALIAVLEDGWPVMVEGGPCGWCSGIVGFGRGAAFDFTLPTPLRTGDTLLVPRLLHLAVQGCDIAHAFGPYPDPPELTWDTAVEGSRVQRLALRSDAASHPAGLRGALRHLRCRVVAPYTGPDPACFLEIRQDATELLIDLRVGGERTVSRDGARLRNGDGLWLGGATGRCLPDATTTARPIMRTVAQRDTTPAAASGPDAAQASVLLEFEVDNPFAWALARARPA